MNVQTPAWPRNSCRPRTRGAIEFGCTVKEDRTETFVDIAKDQARDGAARREVEAEDPVCGLHEHEEHRLVCLRATVRLDVGVGGAEELNRALDGEMSTTVEKCAYSLTSAVVLDNGKSFDLASPATMAGSALLAMESPLHLGLRRVTRRAEA